MRNQTSSKAGYNPDDDDYDMKAATQPPSAETEDVEDAGLKLFVRTLMLPGSCTILLVHGAQCSR